MAGPLPATITDFWRVVWQQKVQIIAMVTDTIEKGQKKCEQYWPDSGSQHYGPFLVTLTEQQVFADYIIRTMQVKVSRIINSFRFSFPFISLSLYSIGHT